MKNISDAEKMSEELNFDDITKVFAGYEPVGSARGIKVVKKKKGKKGPIAALKTANTDE